MAFYQKPAVHVFFLKTDWTFTFPQVKHFSLLQTVDFRAEKRFARASSRGAAQVESVSAEKKVMGIEVNQKWPWATAKNRLILLRFPEAGAPSVGLALTHRHEKESFRQHNGNSRGSFYSTACFRSAARSRKVTLTDINFYSCRAS